MLVKKRIIYLSETDAAGVLFFANQFTITQEVMEEFFWKKGLKLGEHLLKENFVFPIVHTEGEYLAPLIAGDEITIALKVDHIGDSSIRFLYTIEKEGKVVGRVKTTHVCIDKKNGKPVTVPSSFRTLLM